MNFSLPSRPTLIAVSLFAWFSHVPLAHALPVLGASSAASSNGSTATPSDWVTPEYRNSNSYIWSGDNNSAYGYAFSSATGAYAVNTSANGYNGSANAMASILATVTNASNVAQNFSLTFKIYGGWISATNNYALDADEYLSVDYLASIKIDGNQVWYSSASIQNNGGAITYGKSGTDLNDLDDGSDGYYSWQSRYVTIDLGVLDPNESLDVLAELSDSAASNVGVYAYDCGGGYEGYGGYGGYGGHGPALQSTSVCTQSKGNASAFYGDPFEIEANPVNADPNSLRVTTRAVPEPGSLALLALAAGAAGVGRRRKKRD